jgi:hypothetical protein
MIQIRDDKDRLILAIDENGKIAISRFSDMSDQYKDYLKNIYSELTGINENKVTQFLNFEESESILCS